MCVYGGGEGKRWSVYLTKGACFTYWIDQWISVMMEVFRRDMMGSYDRIPAVDWLIFSNFFGGEEGGGGGFLLKSRTPRIEKRMVWNYR